MHAKFKLNDPSELEAELSILATVHDWRTIRDQIERQFKDDFVPWPLSSLTHSIFVLVDEAEKTWSHTETKYAKEG